MLVQKRTDLAVEARELYQETARREPEGMDWEETSQDGIGLTRVHVRNAQGARALDKPVGTYVTADLGERWERDEQTIAAAAHLLARELAALLPPSPQSVLVVGLGNRHITADALGPLAVEKVIVTRHLKDSMPDAFRQFSRVSAISPGVLGLTGVETGEIVQGVCQRVGPDAIIAIDALASRRLSRLCRTVQLSNTGITPGGGIGSGRTALDKATLHAPVIAMGVPTVVDAYTLAADLWEQAGGALPQEEALLPDSAMVVTPKDIDQLMHKSAKVVGYAINMALHQDLSIGEIEELLG